MAYKSAIVGLVGAETALRPWRHPSDYQAWNEKKPLVGVRIHGSCPTGVEVSTGLVRNPFEKVVLRNGDTLAKYVPLYSPAGSSSQQIYADISKNISSWVDNAYRRG